MLSLSNPDPEIDPMVALDARATAITDAMLFAAAEALADLAPEDEAAPNPLDREVHAQVAARVRRAAES